MSIGIEPVYQTLNGPGSDDEDDYRTPPNEPENDHFQESFEPVNDNVRDSSPANDANYVDIGMSEIASRNDYNRNNFPVNDKNDNDAGDFMPNRDDGSHPTIHETATIPADFRLHQHHRNPPTDYDNDGLKITSTKPPPSSPDADASPNDNLLWASPFESYPVSSMSRDAYGFDDDDDDVDGDGERPKCGWGRFTPKCLQACLSVRAYLVVFSMASLVQIMTSYGLVSIVITTIEKRFQLTSFQSGAIMSAYQFATMAFTVFVTYIGEHRHKPRWVGMGSLFLAVGSILFTLPHFLSGLYEYHEYDITTEGVCPAVGNTSDVDKCALSDQDSAEDPSDYFWIFLVAQIFNSLASAPLFTLGVTYMDDNLSASNFAMYIAIFNALISIGPAIGIFIGVTSLSMFTDFDKVDTSSLTITPNNPLWVGAWWVGFLFSAGLIVIFAFLIMAFPKTLPGTKKKQKQRQVQTQKGSEFEARSGVRNLVRDAPQALGKILCNLPFLCICGSTTVEFFVGSGIVTFAPKFIESQFNISARYAGTYVGFIGMAAHFIGSLVSGGIMKAMDLKFRGLVRLCIIAVFLSLLSGLAFVMHCPNTPIAGVSINYINISTPYSGKGIELTSDCNSHCACAANYEPVCGEDGAMYFSPCYAGCTSEGSLEDESLIYFDCRCIVPESNSTSLLIYDDATNVSTWVNESAYGSAVPGRCQTECSQKWPYLVLILLFQFSGTLVGIPAWIAVMRCVSHSQRAFALGVQSLFYGGLGAAPGPVVFGLLIDLACLYWDTSSCEGGACLIYDNKKFAHYFLLLVMCFKTASLVFLWLALCLYKPVGDEADANDDVLGPRAKRAPTTEL